MQFKINPEDRFLFAPDEPAAAAPAAVATETPAASAVTSETPAATTTETAAASTPAQPSSGTTVTQPATQAASWLDSFRKEGFQATDENVAREQLLQAHRDAERLRPLAPALSAYQQHAGEFHKWLADRQKTQVQPTQQADWTKQVGWNHPEYNPAWQHQITKDDKGNLIPAPGAPPDIVLKYQQAQQYRQEFIENFLTNPGKALEPYMRHIAQESAQQFAQQGVGQYREQQEATQFIDKHQDWLFDKAPQGGVKTAQVINPQTGRYESQKVLSGYGKQFVEKLQEGAQAGLSPEMQQQYALTSVQNAYLASPEYVDWAISQRQPPAPVADPRATANAAFTNKANPAAPPAKPSAGNSREAPVGVNRSNLEQVMLSRFREAGIKDF